MKTNTNKFQGVALSSQLNGFIEYMMTEDGTVSRQAQYLIGAVVQRSLPEEVKTLGGVPDHMLHVTLSYKNPGDAEFGRPMRMEVCVDTEGDFHLHKLYVLLTIGDTVTYTYQGQQYEGRIIGVNPFMPTVVGVQLPDGREYGIHLRDLTYKAS